jgi:hypothetical protein
MGTHEYTSHQHYCSSLLSTCLPSFLAGWLTPTHHVGYKYCMHFFLFRRLKINHMLEYKHGFILGPVRTIANTYDCIVTPALPCLVTYVSLLGCMVTCVAFLFTCVPPLTTGIPVYPYSYMANPCLDTCVSLPTYCVPLSDILCILPVCTYICSVCDSIYTPTSCLDICLSLRIYLHIVYFCLETYIRTPLYPYLYMCVP